MSDETNDNDKQIPITTEQLLEVLQKGAIEGEYGVMRWSSNYTFLLSIAYESMTIMAVYKPRKGERPLWDFPDGTLCNRELASFLTSHELGWQIVPPTVLREGPHGMGSMQFFVNHDPNVNYFSFDEKFHPQLQRMAAFDIMINNADRKGGHCLVDQREHLWGIDHGITFNVDHKLRTVIWDFAGEAIPDELLAAIEQIYIKLNDPDAEFLKKLCELIESAEINAFKNRLRKLLQQKRYPKPGAGPNYPWPPV
jgi:uncharacterized repeat protein (TIGR03843 family)